MFIIIILKLEEVEMQDDFCGFMVAVPAMLTFIFLIIQMALWLN